MSKWIFVIIIIEDIQVETSCSCLHIQFGYIVYSILIFCGVFIVVNVQTGIANCYSGNIEQLQVLVDSPDSFKLRMST